MWYLTTYAEVCRAVHRQGRIRLHKYVQRLWEDPNDYLAFLAIITVISRLSEFGLDMEKVNTAIKAYLEVLDIRPVKSDMAIARALACIAGEEACEMRCRADLADDDIPSAMWYYRYITNEDLRNQLLTLACQRGDTRLMDLGNVPVKDQVAVLVRLGYAYQAYKVARANIDQDDLVNGVAKFLLKRSEAILLAGLRAKQLRAVYDRKDASLLSATVTRYAAEMVRLIRRLPTKPGYEHECYWDESGYVGKIAIPGLLDRVIMFINTPFMNIYNRNPPEDAFEAYLVKALPTRVSMQSYLSGAVQLVETGTWTLLSMVRKLQSDSDEFPAYLLLAHFGKQIATLPKSKLKILGPMLTERCPDIVTERLLPAELVPYLTMDAELAKVRVAELLLKKDRVSFASLVRLITWAGYPANEWYNLLTQREWYPETVLLPYVLTQSHALDYWSRVKRSSGGAPALIKRMREVGLDTKWLWAEMSKGAVRHFDGITMLVETKADRDALIALLLKRKLFSRTEILSYVYKAAPLELLFLAIRLEKFNLVLGVHSAQGSPKAFNQFLKAYIPSKDWYDTSRIGNPLFAVNNGSRELYDTVVASILAGITNQSSDDDTEDDDFI